MPARIFQPARSAMQSGTGGTRNWVLEHAPAGPARRDPLMGWTGSADMQAQVRLTFASRAEAVAYAKRHDLDYVLSEPKKRRPIIRPGGYGENFAFDRRESWTH